MTVIDEPFDVLPIDDVDHGLLIRCGDPCLLVSYDHRKSQILQVVPFSNLLRPGITRYTERRYDKYFGNLMRIENQVPDCGQRNHGLAESHIQQKHGYGVCLDIIDAVALVFMRLEFQIWSPPLKAFPSCICFHMGECFRLRSLQMHSLSSRSTYPYGSDRYPCYPSGHRIHILC